MSRNLKNGEGDGGQRSFRHFCLFGEKMTGKNCPFCGAEIEPDKARDKAVCPSCGREFDYNTLNAEARGIIDGKRWARENEARKGAVAIRRKARSTKLATSLRGRKAASTPCPRKSKSLAPSTALKPATM